MIVTVTLNAALDVTYELERVTWNAVNRVGRVHSRAGGKGINVARILAALGEDVVVTGVAGGPIGTALRADLARAGLADELVAIAGVTRRTTAVVDKNTAGVTLFNEAGPTIDDREWRAFQDRFDQLASRARAVVLSGSLPPGVPGDAYAVLARAAEQAGARVVLDADGEALREGVAARPDIVKPNAAELAQATGRTSSAPAEVAAAAELLRAAGARAVVVTLGEAGLLACTPEGRWRARPYRAETGNPTGAGDAAVAALAAGLVADEDWAERLARTTALSAAAVPCTVAGDFDPSVYRAHLDRVTVERL